MTQILFIGSFLSKKKGTKSPSEKIKYLLEPYGIKIKLVSHYENKFIRLAHILFSILVTQSKTIHFDVFSGSAFQITKWGSKLASLRKKHIIFTLHGGALDTFTEKNKTSVLKVFKNASVIQTPSNYLKKYFEEIGIQLNYLPNFIELKSFAYNRDYVKKHSLLWVRAFDKIYNPEIPVYILKNLLNNFPDSHLTMVGPDKGELQRIKAIINELNLQNSVTITGPVKNEELFNYYQSHHVYLNTTSYESFGIAVFEAAACGIPIISNTVGEIPYIWTDNDNILLTQNNDIQQFVHLSTRIFNEPELEKTLTKSALLNVEKFKWENIQDKWIHLLKK